MVYAPIPIAGNEGTIRGFKERLATAFAKAAEVPVGDETAEVDCYTPAQITASRNLKTEWTEVFGGTGSGLVQRFDDFDMVMPEDKLRAEQLLADVSGFWYPPQLGQ